MNEEKSLSYCSHSHYSLEYFFFSCINLVVGKILATPQWGLRSPQ